MSGCGSFCGRLRLSFEAVGKVDRAMGRYVAMSAALAAEMPLNLLGIAQVSPPANSGSWDTPH